MSHVLFVAGLLALLGVVIAFVDPRRPMRLVPVTFFVSWLVADLAVVHLATQVLFTCTIVFVIGSPDATLGSTFGLVGAVSMVVAWTGLVVLAFRHRSAVPVLTAAVDDIVADRVRRSETLSSPLLFSPIVLRRPGVRVERGVRYGDHRRHRLDVHRPVGAITGEGAGRPVLVQIHGGAWVIGNSAQQGQPLMREMAGRGWICVAVNYRLSPKATFPDHLVDVKRAIAWVRAHIAEYGGDPDTIVVTGGSAGGHLAALVALTSSDRSFQPGFEDVDTSVVGCIPFYGVYDVTDANGHRGGAYEELMERVVLKTRHADDPDGWARACPVRFVHRAAPPFFVVQGERDTLVHVEEARDFVAALRAVSASPVGYAEIPWAQHAFDVLVTPRSIATCRAVADVADRFVDRSRSGRSVGERSVGEDRGVEGHDGISAGADG
jgi:acetyl esterase/lipase